METEALISFIKLKSISILGCGWLGKSVGIELIKSGYRVLGSTTQLGKMEEIQAVGIKPVLLKFDPQLSDSTDHEFFQGNTLIISIPPKRKSVSTDIFLEQMKEVIVEALKGNVSSILFISSTSVYPNVNAIVMEEDAESNAYLVKAEKLFKTEIKFKTTILRFGGLVGKDRHPGRFLTGKKDLSGGNHVINIIHQHDCVAIIKSIIQQDIWDVTLNACADKHPTRKEFYMHASASLGIELPQFLDSDESGNKIVSSEKLKQLLKYTFFYPDPMMMLECM